MKKEEQIVKKLGLKSAGSPTGVFPYHDFSKTQKIPWPCAECLIQMYAIDDKKEPGNTVECHSCKEVWVLSEGIWYQPISGKDLSNGYRGWYILPRGAGGTGETVIPRLPSMCG